MRHRFCPRCMKRRSGIFLATRKSSSCTRKLWVPSLYRRGEKEGDSAMDIKIMLRILCFAVISQLVLLPDFLYSQSDFYRGKTLRIVHGRDAGGSGDPRVKALVPFLQKYIPGNPTIVHEFMPGGGGRKAGNYIYGSVKTAALNIG